MRAHCTKKAPPWVRGFPIEPFGEISLRLTGASRKVLIAELEELTPERVKRFHTEVREVGVQQHGHGQD
jgi:hypothetical protein